MRSLVIGCGVLLLLLVFGGCAEEICDYSDNPALYCAKVAELNIVLAESEQAGRDSARPISAATKSMVLFKSDVRPKIEDAPFDVDSVAYGPDGYSVLVCDDADTAVDWLLQSGVRYAQPDADVRASSAAQQAETSAETTEVAFRSWGAAQMGFSAYVQYARQFGSGSATVAVIDSGVYRHSLLTSRIREGGHDYIDNDDDSTNDLNGHGTRVAGIVADCTQDVPVYIYPIRVLDSDGNGKLSNVINAVLEATRTGVDVINLSLSTFAESDILESAIRSAVAAGITVVVAAGNYATDTAEILPAKMCDAGVIVVGSADAGGTRSSFSDYGASVDVYAYGRDISSCSRSGGYVSDSGTSMAAPHISALSAMIGLIHSSISPRQIETRVKAVCAAGVSIPDASAMVVQSGGFRLTTLTISKGESFVMPTSAYPATALETVSYCAEDESVVGIDQGKLTAKAVGTTRVTARCAGMADTTFQLSVTDREMDRLVLPSGLQRIESAAFAGIRTDIAVIPTGTSAVADGIFDGGELLYVRIPDTVEEIGVNDFANAIILCGENSPALNYALEHDLKYVIVTREKQEGAEK